MVWAALLPSLSIIKGTINSKLQQEVLKAPEYPDQLLVKIIIQPSIYACHDGTGSHCSIPKRQALLLKPPHQC